LSDDRLQVEAEARVKLSVILNHSWKHQPRTTHSDIDVDLSWLFFFLPKLSLGALTNISDELMRTSELHIKKRLSILIAVVSPYIVNTINSAFILEQLLI